MYKEFKYLNKLVIGVINELNTIDVFIILNDNRVYNYLNNLFNEKEFINQKEFKMCDEITKEIILIYLIENNIKIMDINLNNEFSYSYYMYFNQIYKNDFLTKEKERELIIDYKINNNQKSKDLLIESYQRLIIKLAKKITEDQHFLLDLIQVGNLALIKCLDNYDLKYNCKLGTFAYPHIMVAIERYNDKFKYFNIYSYEEMHLKRVIDKYNNEYLILNGKYPSKEEIIHKFNITYKTLEKIKKVHAIESLNIIEENELADNEMIKQSNLITSNSVVEHEVEINNLCKDTVKILEDILSPLELKVIKGVYGIDGDVKKQFEIAKELNTTKQNVNISYKNALKKN